MTRRTSFTKRILSMVLCLALIMAYLPMSILTASAEESNPAYNRIADDHTLDQWQKYFGLQADHPQNLSLSTEFAGGVWTDKSVFEPGNVPAELTRAKYNGSSFSLTDKGDNFLVSLSAIASNKEITGYSTVPTDTVLVLDLSSSMRYNDDNGGSAIDELVDATNAAISDLLALNKNNRIAVVLYAGNVNRSFSNADGTTQVLLPLDTYNINSNGIYLQATSSEGNANWALKVADGVSGSNGNITGNKATSTGTFMQDGIYEAMRVLLAADTTVQTGVQAGTQRLPIMVLMTDGEPTLANNDYNGNDAGNNLGNSVMHDYNGSTDTHTHRDTIAFMTMLTAAYAKKQVAAHYGEALFYTLAYGEEVTRLDEALSVMDPAQCSNNMNTLWNSFLNDNAVNVYRYRDGWNYRYLTVQNAASGAARLTADDKLYVDEYFPAETDADFSNAFAAIVNEIIIQSKYYPTYVEKDHDHDGYLTFVDKIGSYMEVSDIKGIVVGNRLFSGAALAGSLGNTDDTLGSVESPTAMGNNFIWSVKERLGISDTSVARALVADAYKHGQLSYVNDQNFSHYIGWFSDPQGNYLDFWHEGMTQEQIQSVVTAKGATHIMKSYGFLGDTTVVGGVSNTDMMYMTVRIATEISSGESILTWQLPASLIPTVTYEVSVNVDSDGNVTGVTDLQLEDGTAESPIRLLYEVELRRDIQDWNLTEKVSGTDYVFYSNKWADNPEDVTKNTYSHFEPSADNERYYYTEDSLVYADDQGTVYTGGKPTSGTYYRQYTVYEKLQNGQLRIHDHYEQITSASLDLAEPYGTNQWVIPKGTIHRYYDFEVSEKQLDRTGTMDYSDHPFIKVGDDHYYTYSTQGNNGKLTVIPATGIKLTKTLAATVEGADNNFTFTLSGNISGAQVIRLDENGNEASRTALPGNGKVTVAAGETVYIIGLQAGNYTVTEEPHDDYTLSSVSVDNVTAANSVNVAVTAQNINDVQFVNAPKGYGNLLITKEVRHGLSGHTVPASVLDQEFTVNVNVGAELQGEELDMLVGTTTGKVTVGNDGTFQLTVKHGETVEILNLPDGTVATVTEVTSGLPAYYQYKGIATRDHSGAAQDTDNQVTIATGENATAIVYNTYNPVATDPVKVDFTVNKVFNAASWSGNADFTFLLRQSVIPEGDIRPTWVPIDSATLNFTSGGTQNTDLTLTGGTNGIVFDKPGQYAYQILEEIPDSKVPGVTYDRTIYTFTVTVTDVNGQLVAAVTDAQGNIISGSHTVTFTNTYHTAPVSFDITKMVDDRTDNPELVKSGFQFDIKEDFRRNITDSWIATGYTTSVYSNTSGQAAPTDYAELAGEARFSKTFEKEDGGTYPVYYRYEVTEFNSNWPGWTYDQNTEYVYFVVNVDNDGNLVASPTDGDGNIIENAYTPVFTNTYNPTSENLSLSNTVRKYLDGRTPKDGEFTFAVFPNIHDGEHDHTHTSTNGALLVGKNSPNGYVEFNGHLTFDKVGTYEYDIVEIAGDSDGVTYSKRVYDLVVEVTDPGNGSLEATYYFEDSTIQQVTFTNIYTPDPAEATISGTKTLTGRPLLNSEFTFRLTEVADENGTAMQDALVLEAENGPATTNTATFSFPKLTYTAEGTHYYKVEEVSGATDNGITYATNSYIVKIVVTDNNEGELEAVQSIVYSSDNSTSIAFANSYKPAKVSASLHSTKELTGRVLGGGEFEFSIVQTGSDFTTPITGGLNTTVQNNTTGGINFPSIEFTEAETRYYVIKEVVGTVPGITYDESEYHVTLTASDNLMGMLIISTEITKQTIDPDSNAPVTVPASSIVFANTYSAAAETVVIAGTKKLEGRDLEANEFKFFLYPANSNYEIEANTQPKEASNLADGSFAFDPITFTEAGTYYYVVVEDPNTTAARVENDSSEYHVAIEIKDNYDTGKLEASRVITKKGSNDTFTEILFTNVFTPKPGDISVNIGVEKTVVNKGSEKIGPENFTFILEDTGNGEKLTVKTDTKGTAVFALGFSEDDIGKTYTYKLTEVNDNKKNVQYSKAVYNITIAISLSESNQLVAEVTKNGEKVSSVVAAFENIYNYTPADPESPKTGNYLNLELWLTLMLVSGGAVVTLAVYNNKKKKETEEI